jgi:hypothetical protein
MPRTILTGTEFIKALETMGVIDTEILASRVVIDAKHGSLVIIHVEKFGDTRLLDVVQTLDGVDIRTQQEDNDDSSE